MADKYIPETNYLMTLVEKEFHKAVKATSDFDNLAFEIEDKTGEHISVSTLKRIWGYVKCGSSPTERTLDVLAKYIGEKDFRSFRDGLKSSTAAHSRFFTAESLNAGDLEAGTTVEIGWGPDRIITLKHLEGCRFEVEDSRNSKLLPGDRFEAASFIKGAPLVIPRILRSGTYTPCYVAGRQGGLTSIKVI